MLYSSRFRTTVNVYGLALLAFAFLPLPLKAQTVATYDFEDGTADGWISFFGASAPAASTNARAAIDLVNLACATTIDHVRTISNLRWRKNAAPHLI